ncbi:hypothetical protein [Ectobacillus sp. sgz5001026]|uniref:hypothetical protein n=1 Tax=Ectobacillus sp. sgz5001026 TaxID=3242473 RepID=UPI0036D21C44
MYCRICGNEEGETANYCTHDGTMLSPLPQHIQLVQGDAKYCRSCGSENSFDSLYCENCGHSLFIAQKKESVHTFRNRIPKATFKFPNIKLLKQGLLAGGLAILLMLLAGLIGSLIMGSWPSILSVSLQNTFGVPFSSKIQFFITGVAPTILNFNLSSFSITGHFSSFVSADFSIGLRIAVFVALFIPLLILGFAGYWITKRHEGTTLADKLTLALCVSITYGLFLFILSFIATRTLNMQDSQLTIIYPHLGSLFRGVLFGFLFSCIGSFLTLGKDAWERLLPFGTAIYQGITAPIKGIFVTLLLSLLVSLLVSPLNSFDGGVKKMSKVEMSVIGASLVPFVWNMAHFAPLEAKSPLFNTLSGKLGITGYDETTVLSASSVQGLKINQISVKEWASTQTYNPDDLSVIDNINTKIHYLSFLFIIPALFFFIAGRKIKRSSSHSIYKELLVFSGVYAIMMVIINAVSRISVHASGQLGLIGNGTTSFIEIGGNGVFVFFTSFILAYAISYTGMLFSNGGESR